MRDGQHDFKAVPALAPGLYSDDNPGLTIDRQGFDSLTFALSMGVGGISFTNTNRIDFVLEHSDDGVTFEPVGANNVLGAVVTGAGIVKSQRTAHPAPTVERFGYVDGTIGDRRFVRLRADFNGTHGTGTPLAVVALLGEPQFSPVG